MLKNKLAAAMVTVGAVVALAACSSGGGNAGGTTVAGTGGAGTGGNAGTPTSQLNGKPVTIGFLGPLSGANAQTGQAQLLGAQVAVDQINAKGGVLGGSQLKLDTKDTAAGANAGAQAVRDFVSAGVPLISGELSSANCLAEIPVVEQLKAVFITATCTNDAITGLKGQPTQYPRTFRTGATSLQDTVALYKAMYQKFPDIDEWDVFAFDYVSGHLQWEQFSDGYKSLGGSIKEHSQYFVPLDQQDYSQQVAAMAAAPFQPGVKRGLYLGTFGAGTASFLQQALPYDFLKNYAVVVNPGSYFPTATQQGGAAPDVWNGYDYNYTAYNTPENTQFVNDYKAKSGGSVPDTWGYQEYLAILAYAAAIDKAGSADADAVQKALEGISFPSPQGTFTIDAVSHQGSANIVMTETVGDPNAPEGVKVIQSVVLTYDETAPSEQPTTSPTS